MTKKKTKDQKILDWYINQQVSPKLEFSIKAVKNREFTASSEQDPIHVTDFTLTCSDFEIEKRYFDDDEDPHFPLRQILEKGDTLSFLELLDLEGPASTIKEILLELDFRGGFNNPEEWKEWEWAHHFKSPQELSSGLMVGDKRLDIFVWPKVVYLLKQDGMTKSQWVDLYQVCFWLQRAYDLQYTLDDELNHVGSQGDDQFLINVDFTTKETPLEASGRLIEPSFAASKLGQLWEMYRAKYSLRVLSEYDYGTRQNLDDGRAIANHGHEKRETKKNEAIAQFIRQHYPSGIQDITISKIARRLVDAMNSDDCPEYLDIFTENGVTPAHSTLRNRLKYIKDAENLD